ncbi:MAG: hypothetical protein HOP30_14930 [Cyclobacteriaceae bacterium]|nr:hypothetical protein [Cyclobacteriaceae bacterium]
MRFTFASLFLLLFTVSWSQPKGVLKKIQKEFESDLEWYVGSVQFRDDQQIKNGSIQYSEKLQTIRFNNNESIEFLSANSVLKFDFYDSQNKKERSFISLEYPVNEVLIKRDGFRSVSMNEIQDTRTAIIFFELLQETKSFVVLRRITPLEVLQPNSPYSTTFIPGDPTSNSPINKDRTVTTKRDPVFGQVITIYFLDSEGNVIPYLRGTRIEKRNSSKMINNNSLFGEKYNSERDIELGEKFLREIMGERFPDVKEFITSNKLDSDKVEDLMKIIEFYKTLED